MCTNTYIFLSKRKNGKKDRVILAKKKIYFFKPQIHVYQFNIWLHFQII